MTIPDRLIPGDLIKVKPKNPLASTTTWGLITLLVTMAVKKWAPIYIQSTAMAAILETLGWLIGSGMIVWGRWNATRPLGLSAATKTATIRLIPLIIILTSASGCGSGSQLTERKQFIIANDTYTATVTTVTALGRNGVLTREAILANFEPTRAAANKLLDDWGKVLEDGDQATGIIPALIEAFYREYSKMLSFRQEASRKSPAILQEPPISIVPD